MAFRLPELVQETSTTTNGASPVTTYSLLGAVTHRKAFSSEMGNGDTTMVIVKDAASPPLRHTFIGTYNTGANTVSVTSTLKGSGVWGAGTRDIYVSPLDEFLAVYASALLAASSRGLLVSNAAFSLSAVNILWAVTGGSRDDFVIDTNNSGATGNPTFTQQYDPVRASGGTELQRTATAPVLSGLIKLATDPAEFVDAGDVGFLKFDKQSDSNWFGYLKTAGGYQRILTALEIDSFGSPYGFNDSVSNDFATIENETAVTLAIPSAGAYIIFVIAQGIHDAENIGALFITIDENIGGGGWNSVKRLPYQMALGDGGTIQLSGTAFHVRPHTAVVNGTTYQYRLSLDGSGAGTPAASGIENHSCFAIALRVA